MVPPDQTETSATPSESEDFSPLAEFGVAPERRSLVRRLLRFAGLAALLVYFGFAAVVLALRFWILPQFEGHPEAVAEAISRNIGQRRNEAGGQDATSSGALRSEEKSSRIARNARVAELADALDLGSSGEILAGSTPAPRTSLP